MGKRLPTASETEVRLFRGAALTASGPTVSIMQKTQSARVVPPIRVFISLRALTAYLYRQIPAAFSKFSEKDLLR